MRWESNQEIIWGGSSPPVPVIIDGHMSTSTLKATNLISNRSVLDLYLGN